MSSARILVVDDDRFFRELIGSQLESRGHRVSLAEDGVQALQRFASEPFDLVLTDVVMPGIDGLALTTDIRRRVPDQEVILVTQRHDAEAVVAALRAGASDYLLKPIEEPELVDRVRRGLERAQLRRESAKLLDENLEFVKHQALYQRCLEMLSTLDLERLQETCLADLCAICEARSGALWVADGTALQLRSHRGLVQADSLPASLDPASPQVATALAAGGVTEVPGKPLSSCFQLPLRAGGDLVGLFYAADKLAGEFGPDDFAVARAVGDFAATALANARRYAAVERLGLRDRETSAYNLAYFLDYAGKELYKARRYGRVFSMLTLHLELERPREAPGAQKRVAAALAGLVRASDVVAKAGDAEFYVLLPETDYLGALLFARRLRAAVEQGLAAEGLGETPFAVGAATFPRDGQELEPLLHACQRRSDEARASLARRLDLGKLDFWTSVELLLGERGSPPLPADDRAGPSRRGYLPATLFPQLQLELALEIARDPHARGLLYIGCGEVRADVPAVSAMRGLPADSAMRVYLLGRRGDVASHPNLTPVFLDADERIQNHQFVVLYSESAAYALVQRRAGRGAPWGFHTSDALVVDELVDQLQACYDLQPL